ncbi:MAG: hypothetical protein MZV65_36115 [Chromatiales bacterium]|nr:hypothetical protein [Chromatiales bacterium]
MASPKVQQIGFDGPGDAAELGVEIGGRADAVIDAEAIHAEFKPVFGGFQHMVARFRMAQVDLRQVADAEEGLVIIRPFAEGVPRTM